MERLSVIPASQQQNIPEQRSGRPSVLTHTPGITTRKPQSSIDRIDSRTKRWGRSDGSL